MQFLKALTILGGAGGSGNSAIQYQVVHHYLFAHVFRVLDYCFLLCIPGCTQCFMAITSILKCMLTLQPLT